MTAAAHRQPVARRPSVPARSHAGRGPPAYYHILDITSFNGEGAAAFGRLRSVMCRRAVRVMVGCRSDSPTMLDRSPVHRRGSGTIGPASAWPGEAAPILGFRGTELVACPVPAVPATAVLVVSVLA
jgi:hypothetical protein